MAQQIIIWTQQKFLYLKWDKAGENIESIYDYGSIVYYGDGGTLNAKSKLVQVFDESTKKRSFVAESNGELNGQLGLLSEVFTDGKILVTHSEISQEDDGTLKLKSVADWTSDLGVALAADQYLTGSLAADGTGEYAAFNKYLLRCANRTFDENDPNLWTFRIQILESEKTGWCIGKQIGVTSDFLSPKDYQDALDRLKTIGVASETKLTTIDFPDEATCGAGK